MTFPKLAPVFLQENQIAYIANNTSGIAVPRATPNNP